ncbi:TetR/AcrR family transcriptional regulator [Nocardia mangyaensis]|uniref:TetR/AcrR family transcriptional regulator n=1 Tax=Nocardia mangyaensis TaxID=2213200 RepID=UPI002675C81F|nr:TetR/AcrR family transcriptional regulator [Nocardia mangyaensis]MDO3645866.1 TetR family transcriptional regulator C-terminal domain-containing protein [Nocardia mangyaensis]
MVQRNIPQQLLIAGLDRFHGHGYHGTAVQDITTTAQVPKGSFYNHYASKEALAVAAIHQYVADSPVQVLFDPTIASPVARVRAHFDALRRNFEDSGMTRGCLLGNLSNEVADHSETIRAALEQAFAAWVAVISHVLEAACEEGEIPADLDAPTAAGFLINAWEGALLRARASKSADPIDAFYALTFSVVLKLSS